VYFLDDDLLVRLKFRLHYSRDSIGLSKCRADGNESMQPRKTWLVGTNKTRAGMQADSVHNNRHDGSFYESTVVYEYV